MLPSVLESAQSWGSCPPESYANRARTGNQLPRGGIASDRRVAHGHHRVLESGVPQPILHERDIRAGVQQMDRHGVAQRMKTPLGLRHGRNPAILLHQIAIRAAFQGDTAGGEQEGGCVIRAAPQIRSDEPEVLRLQGRGFGERAFDP